MFPGFLSKDEKPAVCPLTFIQEEQSRARKRSWGRQEEGAWLRTRTMLRCEHCSCSTTVDSTLMIVWVSEFSLFSLIFKHVWVICCLWLAAENYVKNDCIFDSGSFFSQVCHTVSSYSAFKQTDLCLQFETTSHWKNVKCGALLSNEKPHIFTCYVIIIMCLIWGQLVLEIGDIYYWIESNWMYPPPTSDFCHKHVININTNLYWYQGGSGMSAHVLWLGLGIHF